MTTHHLAQDELAVPGPLEIAVLLSARLVLVDARDCGQIAELRADRQFHGEVDEIVVEERYAAFQAMRHRYFIFHDEDAVEKGLGLEVERVIDVVLGPGQRRDMPVEYAAENFMRVD